MNLRRRDRVRGVARLLGLLSLAVVSMTWSSRAEAHETAEADDTPYGVHVMIFADGRVMGRDASLWWLGGGARLFLGSTTSTRPQTDQWLAHTALGVMAGFRALAFDDGTEAWINQEPLMAYDIAASAEARGGSDKLWSFGTIVGGHLGAAFVPATRMRAVAGVRAFDPQGGSVRQVSSSVPGAVCIDDGICRLDRSYNFALSVGARIGGRLTVGGRRDVTLQLGIDGRAPVRARADIDLLVLLGFGSF
jgi:hypothetical protein